MTSDSTAWLSRNARRFVRVFSSSSASCSPAAASKSRAPRSAGKHRAFFSCSSNKLKSASALSISTRRVAARASFSFSRASTSAVIALRACRSSCLQPASVDVSTRDSPVVAAPSAFKRASASFFSAVDARRRHGACPASAHSARVTGAFSSIKCWRSDFRWAKASVMTSTRRHVGQTGPTAPQSSAQTRHAPVAWISRCSSAPPAFATRAPSRAADNAPRRAALTPRRAASILFSNASTLESQRSSKPRRDAAALNCCVVGAASTCSQASGAPSVCKARRHQAWSAAPCSKTAPRPRAKASSWWTAPDTRSKRAAPWRFRIRCAPSFSSLPSSPNNSFVAARLWRQCNSNAQSESTRDS